MNDPMLKAARKIVAKGYLMGWIKPPSKTVLIDEVAREVQNEQQRVKYAQKKLASTSEAPLS